MTSEQDKFNDERFEINKLLSYPLPNDIIWKARMIVRLDNVATLLGLRLIETHTKEED